MKENDIDCELGKLEEQDLTEEPRPTSKKFPSRTLPLPRPQQLRTFPREKGGRSQDAGTLSSSWNWKAQRRESLPTAQPINNVSTDTIVGQKQHLHGDN